MDRDLDDAEAGILALFIISTQMMPLVFTRLMRSKILRRINRKSQSTSRSCRPNRMLTM